MNRVASQTILLLSADDAFSERLISTLMPKFEVIRGIAHVDDLDKLISASDPDLCIVDTDGPSWDQPADLVAIEEVAARAPTIPIIIATTDLGSTLLLSAMRSGVIDVCEKDFTRDELIAQLDKHANRRSKPVGDRVSSLVTFVGGREGVGTTTTALAFSEIMATRAGDNSSVLLLDFSYPPAEIPDLVGARTSYFMTDAVHDIARLDTTMIESAFTRTSIQNLFVLPLASGEKGINTLSLDNLTKLLAVVRTYFDLIVVDIGWSWRTQLALRLFRSAGYRILCTSQSVTSIHAITSFLTELREVDADTEYHLAITRHDPALSPSAPEIQKALGLKSPPHIIEDDRHYVEMARNAAEPLSRGKGRSRFITSVKHFADEVEKSLGLTRGVKGAPNLNRPAHLLNKVSAGLMGRQ